MSGRFQVIIHLNYLGSFQTTVSNNFFQNPIDLSSHRATVFKENMFHGKIRLWKLYIKKK